MHCFDFISFCFIIIICKQIIFHFQALWPEIQFSLHHHHHRQHHLRFRPLIQLIFFNIHTFSSSHFIFSNVDLKLSLSFGGVPALDCFIRFGEDGWFGPVCNTVLVIKVMIIIIIISNVRKWKWFSLMI